MIPQGIVCNSLIQVIPIVVLERINMHLHQKFMLPGQGKYRKVKTFLPGRRVRMECYMHGLASASPWCLSLYSRTGRPLASRGATLCVSSFFF